MVVGVGQLFDNAYFLFISYYPLGIDDVPQVCDLYAEELTFEGLSLGTACSQLLEHGLQPHKDGWQDLLRWWLYHWGIWCTNWGWGPWKSFPLTAERLQGHWSVWKPFCHTRSILVVLLWMWSAVCSPCPSWPASVQTSGQVRRTIGPLQTIKGLINAG